MIRHFVIGLILSSGAVSAQDSLRTTHPDSLKRARIDKISEKGSDRGAIFVAAGSSFSDGFRINNFLSRAGIVPMQSTEFNLMVGAAYYNRRLDFDLAFETFINGGSDDNTRYKTNTNGIKLRAFYQVLPFEKFGFGAGFNLGWNRRKLQLFWKDHAVDFNDPGVSGNQLTLFLEKPYFGPAIYFKVKGLGHSQQKQLKLTLAYEWGFSDKKWESDYIELENDIFENGHSQLVLNLSVYL